MSDREVRADVELFREIIDDDRYHLSPKRVAHLTDLARETIYAYLKGRINIPIVVWKRLFEETKDLRIINQITEFSDFDVIHRGVIPDFEDDAVNLRAAIDSIKQFHGCQQYLAEALADGKITAGDAAAVAQYNRQFVSFVAHARAIHIAVNNAFAKVAGAA